MLKKIEKIITAGLKRLAGRTHLGDADTWCLGWKAWEMGRQRAPGCCHLTLGLAEDTKGYQLFFFFYNLRMPMSLGWIVYTIAIWSCTSRTQHPPKVLGVAVQPYSRILGMAVELDPTGMHPGGHSLRSGCAAISKDSGYGYVAKPNGHTPWRAFPTMFFCQGLHGGCWNPTVFDCGQKGPSKQASETTRWL